MILIIEVVKPGVRDWWRRVARPSDETLTGSIDADDSAIDEPAMYRHIARKGVLTYNQTGEHKHMKMRQRKRFQLMLLLMRASLPYSV